MKREIAHISGNPGIRSYIPTDKTEIPPDNLPVNVDWGRTNPNETFHKKVVEFNPANAKPLPGVVTLMDTKGYDLQAIEKYAVIGGGVLLLLLVLLKI